MEERNPAAEFAKFMEQYEKLRVECADLRRVVSLLLKASPGESITAPAALVAEEQYGSMVVERNGAGDMVFTLLRKGI